MAGNIVPRSDGGSNLGTASKEFNVIYAKSFGGTIASQVVTTNSPIFTGTPAAPTAATGTNTTQLATTAFANSAGASAASSAVATHNVAADAHSSAISSAVTSAVNTHNGAADAHGDIRTALAGKVDSSSLSAYLPLAGGTMTGRIISNYASNFISMNDNTSCLELTGGTYGTFKNGANLELHGVDSANVYAGAFVLRANSADRITRQELVGKPDGTLIWGDSEIKSMALPSSTILNISAFPTTAPTTETEYTYTAPADGYIRISYRATVGDVFNVQLSVENGAGHRNQNTTSYSSNVYEATLPVTKGNILKGRFYNAKCFTQIFIYSKGEV